MFFMAITSSHPASLISCGQGKMDTSEQGGAESDDAEHPHEKRVFRSWFLIDFHRRLGFWATDIITWEPHAIRIGMTKAKRAYNNFPALNILLGTVRPSGPSRQQHVQTAHAGGWL